MTLTRITLCGCALVLTATGCDSSTANAKGETAAATAAPAPPPPATAAAVPTASKQAEAPIVELSIGVVGDKMEFDKKILTVKAGSKVKLTFVNAAKLKVMSHNWVLAAPGKGDAVGLAGTTAGEKAAFIAPSPDLLAYTGVAKPGETVEVIFTAPPPGKYPYLCSVAGHYVVMKGELVVEG